MTRTLTVKKGSGGSKFSPGWHTATISTAKYGDWNGTKFLDVCFEGYSDKMNMRVYAKEGKNGEEFAIGNIFRFANAGISDGLEGGGGEVTIKLDDSTEQLINKRLNIFLYKDGDYSRVLAQVAPVPFVNIVEEFTLDDVNYWKGRAENFFVKFIKPKIVQTTQSSSPIDAEASIDEVIQAVNETKAGEELPF
tara:strand:+ start:22 stop:600 length:579 start_codon:yes stop_codon:yes gene_type:complete